MRRAIVILATAALLLAVAAVPAAGAGSPHNVWTDNWCDMDDDSSTGTGTITVEGVGSIDLDGRETHFEAEAWNVPGWITGVHAPVIWFGGEFAYYEDGALVDSGVYGDPPPGMVSRVTYCLEVIPLDGAVVVWDPIWLFFPRPAVP